MKMKTNLYKGFSSYEYKKNTIFQTTDIELVKRDLLNAIFTKLGSVPKNRSFGTSIHEYLFKPFDNLTFTAMEMEIISVIQKDPRVEMINLSREPNFPAKSITFNFTLRYVELNIEDVFQVTLNFEA